MRIRSLAASAAAVALLASLTACSGDDDPESKDGSDGDSSSDGSGEDGGDGKTAGPKKPSEGVPDCPFTAQQLSKAFELTFKGKKGSDCAFVLGNDKGQISVTLDRSADNESYEAELTTYEETWDNFEELDVDGQGYVVWSEDNLNIAVGYLDNAGAYRYQVSAVTPEAVGAEDAPAFAEELVDLTVESREG